METGEPRAGDAAVVLARGTESSTLNTRCIGQGALVLTIPHVRALAPAAPRIDADSVVLPASGGPKRTILSGRSGATITSAPA